MIQWFGTTVEIQRHSHRMPNNAELPPRHLPYKPDLMSESPSFEQKGPERPFGDPTVTKELEIQNSHHALGDIPPISGGSEPPSGPPKCVCQCKTRPLARLKRAQFGVI